MLEDFLSYIESNLSIFHEDKILLSVSGGVDSMVMLHLFNELAYKIEVVHINHSTRNGQSDDDMTFVEAICKEKSIPFHSLTLNYKQLSEGNFQENARNERFSFLSDVQIKRKCKWIATAHHKNDRWETFLMHLNRKSGINGLTSLRAVEKNVIHPLLIFTKEEILTFASDHEIKYVHDISNDTDDYKRNAIRNKVTPEIVKIFPDFIQNTNQSIHHLEETSSLIRELIDKSEFVSTRINSNYTFIDLKKVKTFRNKKTLLYHILEGFGFNYSTVCSILEANTSGAIFKSENHEGLFDRGRLIIRRNRDHEKTMITIGSAGTYPLNRHKRLKVEASPKTEIANHLRIDSTKVRWPLTIRSIEPGDKFKPSGMNGASKSLKKLFTDLKINRFDKEEILVICQEDEIIQVLGIRTSHNYTSSDIKNALTFIITD